MLDVLIAQAVDTTSDSYQSGYMVGQLLLIAFIIGAGVIVLRRLRARRMASDESEKDQPTGLSARRTNGRSPARAVALKPDPKTMPPEFDTSNMEAELEGIYRKLGAPQGIEEAKGKVKDLARRLTADKGIGGEEALYQAYEVSLDEHRDYLASQQAAVS
jgi:hypothetical protein